MTLLIQIFFFFAAAGAVALGQQNNTGLDVYFEAAQTDILHQVELGRKDADAIDARYADRLAVIELQQQQLLNEIQQLNETYTQMQYLSFSRKLCIKAYDSQWEYFDKAQQEFNDCNNAAKNIATALTNLGKNCVSTAYSYATIELVQNVRECSQRSKIQTSFEECYISAITSYKLYTQLKLNEAQKYLGQGLFDMEDYTLTAVQCSYKIQLRVQDELKTFKKKVSDCFENPSIGRQDIL